MRTALLALYVTCKILQSPPASEGLWYDAARQAFIAQASLGQLSLFVEPRAGLDDFSDVKGPRLVAALSLIATGVALTSCKPPRTPDLISAVGGYRVVEPRLTGGFAQARCRPTGVGSLIPEPDCSHSGARKATDRQLRRILRETREKAERAPSPETLHRLGLLYLLLPEHGSSLSRGIESLGKAAARAPGNAAIANDLAAGYIVRAQRSDQPEDLVRALAWARRARRLDESQPEASFNEAFALDLLFLGSAADAWRRYARLEEDAAWRGEALARLQAIEAEDPASQWAAAKLELGKKNTDPAAVRKIVRRFPRAARLLVEEEILPAWAEAAAQGYAEQAVARLRAAGRIAREIEALGGDTLLRESVVAIEEAFIEPSRREALVRGHLAYREGLRHLEKFAPRPAAQSFGEARDELTRGGSSFRHWADFQMALCSYYGSDYEESLVALDRLRGEAAGKVLSILQGRISWIEGLSHYNLARSIESLDAFRAARSRFDQAREEESVVAIDGMLADVYRLLGEDRRAWEHLYRALRGLPRIQESRRRHAVLGEAARAALDLGEPFGALAFQDEAVRLAVSSGVPVEISEALRSRAAILRQVGQMEEALADLREADRQVAQVADESVHSTIQARIREVEAELRAGEPERALESLDFAVESFRRLGYRVRLVEALLDRAEVRLALGRHSGAEDDLQAAARETETEWEESIASFEKGLAGKRQAEDQPMGYSRQARDRAGRMARLSVALGQRDGALEILERWRLRELPAAALDLPIGARAVGAVPARAIPRPLRVAEIQEELPDGTAAIEYLLSENQLFTWIVTSNGVRLHTATVREEEIELRIRHAASGLRNRRLPRQDLEKLYDLLIRPALKELGGENLVFVPDGPLFAVPFPALIDSTTGRYLIEDRTVAVSPSTAVTLASFRRDRTLPRKGPIGALVVGDPAFDRSRFSEPRLPGAAEEGVRVAAIYPGARLLTGPEATPSRFLAALAEGPGIVHLAAHALSNRKTPLVSTLLLAPEEESPGALYAHELMGLPLQGTRLAVLSACRSAGESGVEGAGLSGFVRPFLDAGVPAVVASLWQVEDRDTLRLFTVFHERFRAGDGAPEALRAAQLALLKTAGESASPSAWAAFESFGSAPEGPFHVRRNP